ncbi:THUMP domain-containing protein [Geitlerinema sp. PCC 9228]|uniref:THUMP domain-containing protein n=1 Tax=Geitlerinema sp. PCC 9228 TaxID=111611 RepID=UPI0008F998E2|nr:THUMP domain-containing protein [Geitlerinema sp. PCC 9228]
MTILRLTTNPGIEDIVANEFRQKAAKLDCQITRIQCRPFHHIDGHVLVESNEPWEKLSAVAFQMRSVFHVMQHLHQFQHQGGDFLAEICQELEQLDIPPMQDAKTFRTTSKRNGQHPFTSIDVQRQTGAVLVERYGAGVDLTNPDVNVRVDVIEDTCFISLQQTWVSLDQRYQRGFQPRITLKTTMAFAMLHLSKLPASGGKILDPFCGSGTILLEAASLRPDIQLYGSDREEKCVTGTRENLISAGYYQRSHIQQLDARDIAAAYPSAAFHAIVTNPPYGIQVGQQIDFYRLYRKFLQAATQLLVPQGRVVMLVGKKHALVRKVLRSLPQFRVCHERVVETGNIYPHLMVLELLPPSTSDGNSHQEAL